MKVAALILGILAGLSALPLAQYANALVSLGGGKDGSLVYFLPVMSFIGGGIALNMPGAAAGLLGLTAVILLAIGAQFGHAINFITIGPVMFNGVGALLAFMASQSDQEAPTETTETLQDERVRPGHGSAARKDTSPPFNRAKWNALVKYDDDIGRVVEQLKLLGDKWVDVFAADYLALNDKNYLPAIIRKILEQAKEEREEQAKAKERGEVELKASVKAVKRTGFGTWD